jgi:hypothetical protein
LETAWAGIPSGALLASEASPDFFGGLTVAPGRGVFAGAYPDGATTGSFVVALFDVATGAQLATEPGSLSWSNATGVPVEVAVSVVPESSGTSDCAAPYRLSTFSL